jgi:polyferredoxin
MDRNTIAVAYDYERGEPRGKIHKGQERTEGDCINCYQCVAVCPTGIDIRNGLQMECVNCTACIDACDSIMDKVGFDTGLIRYTSENAIVSKSKKLVTPRVIGYLAVLILLWSALGFVIISRNDTGRQHQQPLHIQNFQQDQSHCKTYDQAGKRAGKACIRGHT